MDENIDKKVNPVLKRPFSKFMKKNQRNMKLKVRINDMVKDICKNPYKGKKLSGPFQPFWRRTLRCDGNSYRIINKIVPTMDTVSNKIGQPIIEIHQVEIRGSSYNKFKQYLN